MENGEDSNKVQKQILLVVVVIAVIAIVWFISAKYISFLKDNGLLTLAFGTGCAVLIISALKEPAPNATV